MNGLFQSLESIGLRVAGLTAGLVVADKTGIDEIILGGAQGGSLEESARMSAYLIATEYVSDMALEKVAGIKPPSLHTGHIGIDLVTSFLTNTAVYYLLNQMDITDKIENMVGSGEIQQAAAHALIYALTQEISYRVICMWYDKADPGHYGNKHQNVFTA